MKSSVVKRSIVINGHKTSVSLEDAFWRGFKEIAAFRGVTLSVLAQQIDGERRNTNLSSHIRLLVLEHYRAEAALATATRDAAAAVDAEYAGKLHA